MPRPSSLIRSVSSASSMKRSGSSRPRRGWCQRASASTAQLRPLPSSTSGWKCGLMSPLAMASRSSPTSACRATSASYMPGEKIAQRARPPALAAYIARSALRRSSPAELAPELASATPMLARTRTGRDADAQRRDERAEHALGRPLRLDRRRRVLEQDRELVAAEARGEVVLAQRRAQALGDRHEQRVAGRMAERVVDALELVEVEEHHRRRVVVARERRLDAQREERAVGESGQRIVARLVREPLLELRDRRQRACGLAALERAAGVRPDGLEQTPLTRPERPRRARPRAARRDARPRAARRRSRRADRGS